MAVYIQVKVSEELYETLKKEADASMKPIGVLAGQKLTRKVRKNG